MAFLVQIADSKVAVFEPNAELTNMQTVSSKSRAGESSWRFFRSDRYYFDGDRWFLITREGRPMGPFRDKPTARKANDNLVEYLRIAPPKLSNTLLETLQR